MLVERCDLAIIKTIIIIISVYSIMHVCVCVCVFLDPTLSHEFPTNSCRLKRRTPSVTWFRQCCVCTGLGWPLLVLVACIVLSTSRVPPLCRRRRLGFVCRSLAHSLHCWLPSCFVFSSTNQPANQPTTDVLLLDRRSPIHAACHPPPVTTHSVRTFRRQSASVLNAKRSK